MKEELYLILHKVRGEPAFDIAQKIMIGEEEGWIIPTSGHRAYPYWFEPLNRAVDFEMCRVNGNPQVPMPDDHPDHYDTKRDDGKQYADQARAILIRKGLINPSKPAQTLHRRF